MPSELRMGGEPGNGGFERIDIGARVPTAPFPATIRIWSALMSIKASPLSRRLPVVEIRLRSAVVKSAAKVDVAMGRQAEVGVIAGLGTVIHRDGAGFGEEVDGSRGGKDVGMGLLGEVPIGEDAEVAGGALDTGFVAQGYVAASGLEKQVTFGSGCPRCRWHRHPR